MLQLESQTLPHLSQLCRPFLQEGVGVPSLGQARLLERWTSEEMEDRYLSLLTSWWDDSEVPCTAP